MELCTLVAREGIDGAAKRIQYGGGDLGYLAQRVLLGAGQDLEGESETAQAAAYRFASQLHPPSHLPELSVLLRSVTSALSPTSDPALIGAALVFLRGLPEDLVGQLGGRKDVFTAILGLQEHDVDEVSSMASTTLLPLLEQLWIFAGGLRPTGREFATLAEAQLRRQEILDLVSDVLQQHIQTVLLSPTPTPAAAAAFTHVYRHHAPVARFCLRTSVEHLLPDGDGSGPPFAYRAAYATEDASETASLARLGAPSRRLWEKLFALLSQRLYALADAAFQGNATGLGLLFSLVLSDVLSQPQGPSPAVLLLARDWLNHGVLPSLSLPGPSSSGFSGLFPMAEAALLLLSTAPLSRYRAHVAPMLTLALTGGAGSLQPPVSLEQGFGEGGGGERMAALGIRCLAWLGLPTDLDDDTEEEERKLQYKAAEAGWMSVASSCLGAALLPSSPLARVALLSELCWICSRDALRRGALRPAPSPLLRLLRLPWITPLLQDPTWDMQPFRAEILLAAVAVTRRVAEDAGGDALALEILSLASPCLLWDWPQRAREAAGAPARTSAPPSAGGAGTLALLWEEFVALLDETCQKVTAAADRETKQSLAYFVEDLISWKLSEGVAVPQLRVKLCVLLAKHLHADTFDEDNLRFRLAADLLDRLEQDLFAVHAQSHARQQLKKMAHRGHLGGMPGQGPPEVALRLFPSINLRTADALTLEILPGIEAVAALGEVLRVASLRMLERRLDGGESETRSGPKGGDADANLTIDASGGDAPLSPTKESEVVSPPDIPDDPFGSTGLLSLAFVPDAQPLVPTPLVPNGKAGDAALTTRAPEERQPNPLQDGLFSRLGFRANPTALLRDNASLAQHLRRRRTVRIGPPALPLHLYAAMQSSISTVSTAATPSAIQSASPAPAERSSTPVSATFLLAADGAPEAFLWMDPLSLLSPLRLRSAMERVMAIHLGGTAAEGAEASKTADEIRKLFPADLQGAEMLMDLYERVNPPEGLGGRKRRGDTGALRSFWGVSGATVGGGGDPVAVDMRHSLGMEAEAQLWTFTVTAVNVTNIPLEGLRLEVHAGAGLELYPDLACASPYPVARRAAIYGSKASQAQAAPDSRHGPPGSETSLHSAHRSLRPPDDDHSEGDSRLGVPCPLCHMRRAEALPPGASWEVEFHGRLVTDGTVGDGVTAGRVAQHWVELSVGFAGVEPDPEDAENGDAYDAFLAGEDLAPTNAVASDAAFGSTDDLEAFPTMAAEAAAPLGDVVLAGWRYHVPIHHTILPLPPSMRSWRVFKEVWSLFFFSYKAVREGRRFQLAAVNGRSATEINLAHTLLEENLGGLASALLFASEAVAEAAKELFECPRHSEGGAVPGDAGGPNVRAMIFASTEGSTVALFARAVQRPFEAAEVWQLEFRSNRPMHWCI